MKSCLKYHKRHLLLQDLRSVVELFEPLLLGLLGIIHLHFAEYKKRTVFVLQRTS